VTLWYADMLTAIRLHPHRVTMPASPHSARSPELSPRPVFSLCARHAARTRGASGPRPAASVRIRL